ncbi:ATP-dependent DNA helicase [Trichonephila clavipes]|nr:ATP-dependent DNA helicase [Trichonephila clavipes]
MYDVTINDSFFNLNQSTSQVPQEEISENITIEESLTAQKQTLLWNEEKYLRIAPGEANVPRSLLLMNMRRSSRFQQFIWIILKTSEKESESYTIHMIATSELRRVDRRGVTPHHLLYMAMKIM